MVVSWGCGDSRSATVSPAGDPRHARWGTSPGQTEGVRFAPGGNASCPSARRCGVGGRLPRARRSGSLVAGGVTRDECDSPRGPDGTRSRGYDQAPGATLPPGTGPRPRGSGHGRRAQPNRGPGGALPRGPLCRCGHRPAGPARAVPRGSPPLALPRGRLRAGRPPARRWPVALRRDRASPDTRGGSCAPPFLRTRAPRDPPSLAWAPNLREQAACARFHKCQRGGEPSRETPARRSYTPRTETRRGRSDRVQKMEPARGFEPLTCALRVRCSTTEPRRPGALIVALTRNTRQERARLQAGTRPVVPPPHRRVCSTTRNTPRRNDPQFTTLTVSSLPRATLAPRHADPRRRLRRARAHRMRPPTALTRPRPSGPAGRTSGRLSSDTPAGSTRTVPGFYASQRFPSPSESSPRLAFDMPLPFRT